jgi:hypothetical protein
LVADGLVVSVVLGLVGGLAQGSGRLIVQVRGSGLVLLLLDLLGLALVPLAVALITDGLLARVVLRGVGGPPAAGGLVVQVRGCRLVLLLLDVLGLALVPGAVALVTDGLVPAVVLGRIRGPADT